MRKLFLTSAGLPGETRNYFLQLLTKEPNDTKVAFIPTAGDHEKNKKYIKLALNELKRIGFRDIQIIDLKTENKRSLLNKLSDCDVIYVNGGNSFYLLYHVRRSGFDKVVKKLINKGKIYVGVSAGSYIACPSIEAATWKHQDRNRFGIKDLSALNLVSFLITAHFTENYRRIVEREAKKTKYPIIALNDKQAILIKNKEFTIVGKGKINVFNKIKRS